VTSDRDLHERFALLRAQTEQNAPSFEAITARLPREPRRPVRARAALTALVMILASVLMLRLFTSPAPPADLSIAAWKSPTAFLLDVGRSAPGMVRGRGDFPTSFLSPTSPRQGSPSRSSSSRENFS